MINSLESQEWNFEIPYQPEPLTPIKLNNATYLGYGRIVRDKHLPSLIKLGFKGDIQAYDLIAHTAPNGQQVKAIHQTSIGDSDLFIITSPGPAHVEAIPQLENLFPIQPAHGRSLAMDGRLTCLCLS